MLGSLNAMLPTFKPVIYEELPKLVALVCSISFLVIVKSGRATICRARVSFFESSPEHKYFSTYRALGLNYDQSFGIKSSCIHQKPKRITPKSL